MTDSNWQRGGNIVIALILIFLTLPELQNVYTKNHYNLSFCSDSELMEVERFDFFACEIGYLGGEMSIILQLISSESENWGLVEGGGSDMYIQNHGLFVNINILILNQQNYNNFYDKENYDVSNIEFLSLNINKDDKDLSRNFPIIDIPSDYYFLVFDWEYGKVDEVEYANTSTLDISYSINLKHNNY